MKKWLIILVAAAALWSCGQSTAEEGTEAGTESTTTDETKHFGDKIDEAGALTPQELKEKMKTSAEYEGKVSGEVVNVCKAEGCWLTLDMGDGTGMHVDMHDHSFFVPKDITSKTAVLKGRAYMDTVSVDMLKHLAEDEGKPQEEIDKITEPEVKLVFDAEGVLLK